MKWKKIVVIMLLSSNIVGCGVQPTTKGKTITNEGEVIIDTFKAKSADELIAIIEIIKKAGFTFKTNPKSIPTALVISNTTGTNITFAIVDQKVKSITYTHSIGSVPGLVYINNEGNEEGITLDEEQAEQFNNVIKSLGVSIEDVIQLAEYYYTRSDVVEAITRGVEK